MVQWCAKLCVYRVDGGAPPHKLVDDIDDIDVVRVSHRPEQAGPSARRPASLRQERGRWHGVKRMANGGVSAIDEGRGQHAVHTSGEWKSLTPAFPLSIRLNTSSQFRDSASLTSRIRRTGLRNLLTIRRAISASHRTHTMSSRGVVPRSIHK